MNKIVFNKLKNFLKLSKIKKKLDIIALAAIGFALGKFFGLGAIIGGAMVYKKAAASKTALTQRLVATTLGCLTLGILATVLGSIGIVVASKAGTINTMVFGIIGIAIWFVIARFVKKRTSKKVPITTD